MPDLSDLCVSSPWNWPAQLCLGWVVLLCVGWGALCASSIGFLLCRRLGRARIERFVASRRPLAALKLAVEERALLVTAVARCCPVIPFGQCTLVLSVSRIEVRSTLA